MNRTMKIALVALVVSLPLLMAPTGGSPSRPTFQQVTIRQAAPTARWQETDAAANEKVWRMVVSGGDLFIGTQDDTFGGGANAVTMTRTGTTVDNINFAATTVQANSADVATVISAAKPAFTSRANTVVSAADPNLTFTLPVGTWEVRASLMFTNTTTSTQGARYQVNFAGTFDPARVVRCTDIRTTLLTTGVVGVNAMNFDTTIPDVSTTSVDIADMRCVLRATVAGVLQVRWAQETSSANVTTLESGSSLHAIRIGS